ncbi:restriction endonuclease subunit S [Flavobacterium sp. KS-LB2]|uniref:restriction endonuclease subunit S n=1 Tax=Flavobacterium sp. KS-LB2 TaxID=3120525 RepID=UPI0030CE1110
METLQPKLRFPEFDGNWYRKLFKETCQVNPSNKKLPTKFIYIDLESVNDGLLSKENEILLDDAPSRAQRLLAKEDVLFQMVRPYQKNNLYFDKDGDYVASTGYAQLRANASSKFLFQYLHNQKFVDKVIEKCTGSNYPSINSTDLANIFVVFPENNEQTRIANFLSSVDEKLNLLKEKRALLEEYKKGIMQKIFNQEIRFKDDNGEDFGEWENVVLGNVSDVRDGTHDSPKYVDNGYPLITSKNLNSNGKLDFNNVEFISQIDFDKINKRSKVDIGDIIFGMIGTIGNPVLLKSDEFAIKNVALIKEKQVLKNSFLIHFLNSSLILNQFKKENVGGTQKFLSLGIIRNLDILLPSIEEQTKIANFLSAIDEKIELVSNQIQDTQEYKKGLLQQMFV